MADYIIAMATTIQISGRLLKELKEKKISEKESYEELIWDLLEDTKELSEETKKEIELSRKQIKEGKVHSFETIKKEIGS